MFVSQSYKYSSFLFIWLESILSMKKILSTLL